MGALRALVASVRPDGCEFCALDLLAEHEHVLECETGTLRCACRACALCFEDGPSRKRVRSSSKRRDVISIDRTAWNALGVPVRLAWVHRRGTSRCMVATYPSVLGPVEAPLDPAAWAAFTVVHPALPAIADDVEALLVWIGVAPEAIHVSIDECYRLAGRLRQVGNRTGGVHDVTRVVDEFFARFAAEGRP